MLKFEVDDGAWKGAIEFASKRDATLEGRLNGYYDILATKDAGRIKKIFDMVYDKSLLAVEKYKKEYDELKKDFDSGRIRQDVFAAGCYNIYVDSMVLSAEVGFVDSVITEQEIPKVISSHADLLRGYGYDIPTFLRDIDTKMKPSIYMRRIIECRLWWDSVQRDDRIYRLLKDSPREQSVCPDIIIIVSQYGDDSAKEFKRLVKDYGVDLLLLNYSVQERVVDNNGIDIVLADPEVKNVFELYAIAKEEQDRYNTILMDILDPIMWQVRNVITKFLISKKVLQEGDKVICYTVINKYEEYISCGIDDKKDR